MGGNEGNVVKDYKMVDFPTQVWYGNNMKKDIHPTYHSDVKVVCACGNAFTLGSTQESIQVEVCSACHPFYTGKDRTMDRLGQIQKFKKRLSKKA